MGSRRDLRKRRLHPQEADALRWYPIRVSTRLAFGWHSYCTQGRLAPVGDNGAERSEAHQVLKLGIQS